MPINLTEEQIAARLKAAYQPGKIAFADQESSGDPICAAVLIPLIWNQAGWELVFTRRTETVESHKGQVSFPGGACDAGDGDVQGTALREADEEIGLKGADVRILGRLNDMVTISNYRVTPVVGVIPWPYPFRLSAHEVSRVFSIPLLWLAQAKHRRVEPYTPDGSARSMPVILFEKYDDEILWGISARITVNLLEVLGS